MRGSEQCPSKMPLSEVRKKLGRHPFALLSDAPNGRVWCYVPTGQLVDDEEAIRAVEEGKRPKIAEDYQI